MRKRRFETPRAERIWLATDGLLIAGVAAWSVWKSHWGVLGAVLGLLLLIVALDRWPRRCPRHTS